MVIPVMVGISFLVLVYHPTMVELEVEFHLQVGFQRVRLVLVEIKYGPVVLAILQLVRLCI